MLILFLIVHVTAFPYNSQVLFLELKKHIMPTIKDPMLQSTQNSCRVLFVSQSLASFIRKTQNGTWNLCKSPQSYSRRFMCSGYEDDIGYLHLNLIHRRFPINSEFLRF